MEVVYGLVPENTGGPKVRIIRLNIGGIDVDMQVIMSADPATGEIQGVLVGGYAKVKTSSVVGSDGTVLDLDSWAHTLNWNGDGTLNYDQVTYGVKSWRQTLTYAAGKVTGISDWVLQ
jgi:hypothetical protein